MGHGRNIESQTHDATRPASKFKSLLRFLASWFCFFFILGAPCPFCGQIGCAGSAASAGILGGIAVICLWVPKHMFHFCRVSLTKIGGFLNASGRG